MRHLDAKGTSAQVAHGGASGQAHAGRSRRLQGGSGALSVEEMLFLQRTAGNRAARTLVPAPRKSGMSRPPVPEVRVQRKKSSITATATWGLPVLTVSVNVGGGVVHTLTTSTQRHTYEGCHGAAPVAGNANSLLTMTAAHSKQQTDAEEIIKKAYGKPAALRVGRAGAGGRDYVATGSGRTYRLDLLPNPPGAGHFFVIGGEGVWEQIPQAVYMVVRAFRRMEQAFIDSGGIKEGMDKVSDWIRKGRPVRDEHPAVIEYRNEQANYGYPAADVENHIREVGGSAQMVKWLNKLRADGLR